MIAGAAPAASAATVAVRALLDTLTIAPVSISPYDRASFGDWIDADHDGCDTRSEVLQAQSWPRPPAGCPVQTGTFFSWYDGKTWTQASDVEVDHAVPLAEAWRSGAWAWTPGQREAYANDLDWPHSLVVATAGISASRADRDPAGWLPPHPLAVCDYVADWVAVKYRWSLSVDQVEHDALATLLGSTCGDPATTLPSRAGVPVPAAVLATEAYVTQVYRDLFHRDPDAGGLATWTGWLLSGTPYGAVANAITASDEYREGMVRAVYQRYLGRVPEADGLVYWMAQMRAGLQIEQMAAGFIASDEFYARGGGTPQGWVTLLYRTVLGRAPAPSEVSWWVDAIGKGMNRGTVALGFLYSDEHLTTVVDGYYVDLLGRHLDPSGNAWWVGLIQAGHRDEEIIASIVSSPEYRSKV